MEPTQSNAFENSRTPSSLPPAEPEAERPRKQSILGITPTTDRDEALSQLQREGFCVLEDVMGADALPALREELVRHMQDPER